MPHISVRRRRPILAAVACLALAGGCQSAGKSRDLPSDVWASVDGREIRRDDVEKAYRRELQPTPVPPSDDEVLATKLSLIDAMITQDILLDRARALKVDVTPAELEAAFTERKGAMSDELFQQELRGRNLSADDMREGLRRQLLADKVLERDVVSKIVITDADITDHYNKHRAEFNVLETQYHIAQILVTPVKEAQVRNRKNDDAATPADATRKAAMLMDRLKAGAEFGQLAMDYSEDPQSAPQGGDLGFISASQLNQVPPVLRDAVIKAQPGTVNVVSVGGAHTIVLLLAREAAGQRDITMPTVKDGISTDLHDRKAQLLRAAYVTAARNDARIVNNLARQLLQAQGKLPGLAPSAPGK